MTTTTYKQIAEALGNGETIKTICNEWKQGRGYKHSYFVEFGGERFEISAQSWGKLRKDLRNGRVKYVEVGSVYGIDREGASSITVIENAIAASNR